MRIYTEVYGCSANLSDYEIALGLLKERGFSFSENPHKSVLNIIFTCCVKVPTTSRMFHRIAELTKSGRPLIVAGCISKVMRSSIEKINPSASLVGPDALEKIVDAVDYTLKGKKFVWLKDLRKPKVFLPKLRKNPVIDVIEISTGCLGSCSYCIVKNVKGNLFSYPPELIVKEAKFAVNDGCKELWLTSQDSSCYGADIKTTLPNLINNICEIHGKFFIRVGMMNPDHAKQNLQQLIEAYKNEKVFKFLHLPVQSFSPRILKEMKRNYSPNMVLEVIEKFYKVFPRFTLSTDVIVGFPGESDEDFQKTIDFVKKIKPDIVNISKFGLQPNTEAAKMEQLPRDVVDNRSRELTKVVKQITLEKNQKWIGWSGECLIDERGKKNSWIGRNFSYKPVVIRSNKKLLGEFVRVEVTDAKSNYLIGNVFGC